MDAKTIKMRFDALLSQRNSAEQAWDEIERYIMPLHGGKFFEEQTSEHEVEWHRREIFDETAITDADTLSAALHGSLTSPAIKWFTLAFRDDKLQKEPESAAWLQECSKIIYQTLQESNFDMEVAEMYLDLVGFGNSCVTLEVDGDYDNFEGINFTTIPIRGIYFDMDKKSQIFNLYRRLEMTVTEMIDKFGVDGVPEDIAKLYTEDTTAYIDRKFTVIFCIYKRKDADPDINTLGPVAIEARPFGSSYVLHKSAELLGEPGGYYEMPGYVPRWRKTSGSQWGYGPSHLAISTVMTLNEYVKLDLKAAEKVVDPATLVTERGLITDLDLEPAGLTVVRDLNSVAAFESKARFDVTDARIAGLQNQIHRIYKIDQLQLKDSPAMSATEASIRYELMNRLIGPTLGRLKTDFFSPMIGRVFNILWRAGQLPELPDTLADADSALDVKYTGPMDRAQKMDQIASIERWLTFIGQFGEAFPDMVDVPNEVMAAKEMAEILDVSMTLVHSDAELSKIKRLKEEVQQLQQQLMAQQAQGDAMKAQGEGAQAMQAAEVG